LAVPKLGPKLPVDPQAREPALETLMPITALYAALLTPLFILISIRVIRARRDARVPLGDGGDVAVLRCMRVHANFAEYVPLTLLLMALAESLGTVAWLLHIIGLVLVFSRLVHAFGVSQGKENFSLRVAGVATTFFVLTVAALACLFGSFQRGFGL
jgi:uncharacterized membrane protein YecN with MAPEG domain